MKMGHCFLVVLSHAYYYVHVYSFPLKCRGGGVAGSNYKFWEKKLPKFI